MFPRVRGVRHLKDYELEITFSDGTVAALGFRRRVVGRGRVFGPLESVDFFAKVTVDQKAGTLVWPNGVDFCPDVLYSEATAKPISDLDTELELA
jgi:hypothetical protein